MTTSETAASTTSAVGPAAGRPLTRYLTTTVRILLGLPLLVFGLNGFLNFIPPPSTPLPEEAAAFAGALFASGYMMQLIAATHLVVGALLVANRFVPLALVLLAPFLVNSMAFHLVLEPTGLPMASVFVVLELYLVWIYRRAYRPLFVARAPVGASKE